MDGNVAFGLAGVLSGVNNQACGNGSGIGTGANNLVTSQFGLNGSRPNDFIGAGDSNLVSRYNNGVGFDSFIGSGAGNENTTNFKYAAIAAGASNVASSPNAFIGSGEHNTVGAVDAVLVGGYRNSAGGELAAIAGGTNNGAQGLDSAVPGGSDNAITGAGSFAAGHASNVGKPGAFVWSDDASGATQLKSTANNQFLARASGGFVPWTNASNTVGAKLNPGSGTWSSASDRTMKANVVDVDDAVVLEKVESLPISKWSYTSERGVRHVGPMAQDFYGTFGVGEDDRHITSIDEGGVVLAAIKALHGRNGVSLATIKALHRQLAETNARLAEREAMLHRLNREVENLAKEVAKTSHQR